MSVHIIDQQEQEVLERLAFLLRERGWLCATAESCTGGLVGAAITSVPGSSAWYMGSVISYSNEVKLRVLRVPARVLSGHGAVSGPVALAMATGVCRALQADCSMALTGIAGPDGGSLEKPVGTVWIGWAVRGEAGKELVGSAGMFHFSGNREDIRLAARLEALKGLVAVLEGNAPMH